MECRLQQDVPLATTDKAGIQPPETTMTIRTLQQTIQSVPTSDGAGVRLRRSLGRTQTLRLDPFLMLDEFSSQNPDDYVAGFPSHPHRGFETVTYMLDGHMLHEDHLGHRGDLRSGGAQWMTAGRGIIHSEMPQQESGRMRGFQLWINLPAREKMKPAAYRDIQPEDIPRVALAAGGYAKVIAGTFQAPDGPIAGPIQGLSTAPLYFDVSLPAGARFALPVAPGHNAFLYPYEGALGVGPADALQPLDAHAAGVLSAGDTVAATAAGEGARFLLLAGRPLGEPVVQHGPFVMNTRDEIEQALQDYRNGVLV
jgi:redox-sensitive bicupin YhaK (pirin superfamily)